MSRAKRSFGRWLGETLRSVFSMFESKHDQERGPARYSQFRVVLGLFAWGFYTHWPETWTRASVAALASILFAPALDTLMFRIPATEALEAVAAFFSGVVANAAGKAAKARNWSGRGDPIPGLDDDRGEP